MSAYSELQERRAQTNERTGNTQSIRGKPLLYGDEFKYLAFVPAKRAIADLVSSHPNATPNGVYDFFSDMSEAVVVAAADFWRGSKREAEHGAEFLRRVATSLEQDGLRSISWGPYAKGQRKRGVATTAGEIGRGRPRLAPLFEHADRGDTEVSVEDRLELEAATIVRELVGADEDPAYQAEALLKLQRAAQRRLDQLPKEALREAAASMDAQD